MRYHRGTIAATLFTTDLVRQDVTLNGWPNHDVSLPRSISRMIEAAERIGRDFLMIRVDLYDLDDALWLSELTLCVGNARHVYSPKQFAIDIGRRWQLA